MKLSEVLKEVKPVRGWTSVMAAIGGGELESIVCRSASIDDSIEVVAEEYRKAVMALDRCKSDAAYWGYLGHVTYWKMVARLLEAAALVGPDDLPDVKLPSNDGVVMQLIDEQEKFGKAVVVAARRRAHVDAHYEGAALSDVVAERMRQDKKWGEQNHDPFVYLTVLGEEFGETCEAALHAKFGGPKAQNLRTEAVQLAAVALAIVECLDRGKWTFRQDVDERGNRLVAD